MAARLCGIWRAGDPLTVALLLAWVALLVGVLLLVPRLLRGRALLVPRLLLAVLGVSCRVKETQFLSCVSVYTTANWPQGADKQSTH